MECKCTHWFLSLYKGNSANLQLICKCLFLFRCLHCNLLKKKTKQNGRSSITRARCIRSTSRSRSQVSSSCSHLEYGLVANTLCVRNGRINWWRDFGCILSAGKRLNRSKWLAVFVCEFLKKKWNFPFRFFSRCFLLNRMAVTIYWRQMLALIRFYLYGNGNGDIF